MFKYHSPKALKLSLHSLLFGSLITLGACGGGGGGSGSDPESNIAPDSIGTDSIGTDDTGADNTGTDNTEIDSTETNGTEIATSPAPSRSDPFTGQAQLGPLINATLELRLINQLNGPALFTTQTDESDDLSLAGLFRIPEEMVTDQDFYLISITGGEDIDANDDGVLDDQRTTNIGTIHSIITGAQIKAGNFGVSIVTEVVYQNNRYLLATQPDFAALGDRLRTIARRLLRRDITDDSEIAMDDILAWQPTLHQTALVHNYSDYQTLIDDIHAGRDVLYNSLPFNSFEIAHIDNPSPQGVVIKNGYALLAHSQQGFNVIDVRDNQQPVIVTTPRLHRDGEDIALFNNTAYIATGVDFAETPGLSVWDVTNPVQAVYTQLIDSPFTERNHRDCTTTTEEGNAVRRCEVTMFAANRVETSDRYAYVIYNSRALFEQVTVSLDENNSTNPTSGIQVIDLNDNTQVDFVDFVGATDIALTEDGQTAYVLDGKRVVRVNTHKDTDGTLEREELTSISGDQLTIANNHLYLYTAQGNLDIYSLPVTRDSIAISSLTVSGNRARSLEVIDNHAYIGVTGTVRIVDVSNVQEPFYKAGATNRGPVTEGLAVEGDFLYVANQNAGFIISDIGAVIEDDNYREDFPAVVDNQPEVSTALVRNGNHLYVANHGLTGYEITDQGALAPVSNQAFEDIEQMQIVDQQLITVSNTQHVSTFSLADPSTPTFLGSTSNVAGDPLPTFDKGLVVHNQYAYVSTSPNNAAEIAVHVYDLSAGDDNTLVETLLPVQQERRFGCTVRNGDYLYAIGDRRVEIFNLAADPISPPTISTARFPLCEEIIIRDDIAYIASGNEGVFIYNFSSALNPTELSHFDTTGHAGGIFLDNELLYIGSFNSVSVANISNPSRPTLIGAARTPGEPEKLLVTEEYVVVIDGSNGITVLHALDELNDQLDESDESGELSEPDELDNLTAQ